MKIEKLNFKILKSLKSTEKRYRVQVENSKGLFLVVNVNGSINFTYRYQLDGWRRDISLGSFPSRRLAELNKDYATAVADVANGIDPLAKREQEQGKDEANPTVKKLAARYLEHYVDVQLKPRTQKEYRRQLDKYILPKLGKRKAKEMKRAAIVALVERQVKQYGPIMANRNLAVIKGLFSYGIKVGVLEHSPAAGISPPGKPVIKDRVLSLDEISLMIKALDDAPRDARDILLLVLLTGQRPGEVCAMHESQLKGDWWNMAGIETKSGRSHRAYLSRWARDIIQARQNDGLTNDYIFPGYGSRRKHLQPDNLKNWFHRKLNDLFKESGITESFTAHDLRRSAATGMAILGHAAVVPDILNHAPQGITRTVYDRYDRGPEIERALIVWSEAVQRAIGGNQADVIEINS